MLHFGGSIDGYASFRFKLIGVEVKNERVEWTEKKVKWTNRRGLGAQANEVFLTRKKTLATYYVIK